MSTAQMTMGAAAAARESSSRASERARRSVMSRATWNVPVMTSPSRTVRPFTSNAAAFAALEDEFDFEHRDVLAGPDAGERLGDAGPVFGDDEAGLADEPDELGRGVAGDLVAEAVHLREAALPVEAEHDVVRFFDEAAGGSGRVRRRVQGGGRGRRRRRGSLRQGCG
ncbi:hypothetical protein O0235_06275 [Tepidiforma flava]|uniref:Uncharacterized protein n=1 Tax=Tepidiforma flava TaxID=3004094 RepID=A0ABY7M9G7_9CHLR|nr:hypothetical protein [Tepidiforma flava]WBL37169.1 hypothetical protein O0235_06275 [Tepidiforma flava]